MDLPLSSPEPSHRKTQYHIQTRSLSYTLPSSSGNSLWSSCHNFLHPQTRSILKDITCEANPGELLAIVGPSGAGKTTLLSILAGVIHPQRISGDVLINGIPMNISRFRRISGYVSQEDTLFPLLTVKESLLYTARLRLGVTVHESMALVFDLLKALGLDHVAETKIGGGISGGERRRVSIGNELVHNPSVLLLDEPTSGLDSVSALHIIHMLKSMAMIQSKTIVLTIHQPGFRILELLDKLLLISGGIVCHNGSIESLEKKLIDAGHYIPHHINILEFAMDSLSMSSCSLSSSSTSSTSSNPLELYHRLVIPEEKKQIQYPNSRCRETSILTERFFKNILRTRQLFTARLIQSAIAGIGLGTVFMNVHNLQARVGFFAFSLTFLLSSTTEGLPIFLQERRILMKETSRGAYRVSSYVAANALVFLPFLLTVALLYSIPVYFLVGLRRQMDCFLYFSLVVWMVMLMANSFVAFFSALVPNFIMGNSLIAGFMGSFFLFSGYFISRDSIPKYWIFMHYLSLFKYPFEAFVINEYGGDAGRRQCMQVEGSVCVLDGGLFLRQQGFKEVEKWRNIGVMLGFICGYRILSLLVLWFRCYRVRR